MNLDFYRRPATMSDAGRQAALLRGLPQDVAALAKIVQGLLIHEHIAPAYGVTLSGDQHAEAHLRPVESMLEQIAAHDARPLAAARPAGERLVGVCRHFTPSTSRCCALTACRRGRAAASAPISRRANSSTIGTEYWNAAQERW